MKRNERNDANINIRNSCFKYNKILFIKTKNEIPSLIIFLLLFFLYLIMREVVLINFFKLKIKMIRRTDHAQDDFC